MKKPDRLKRYIQLIVVGLFLMVLVSGGSQWFLSPKRIANWIKDSLPEYENLDIEFSKAQISFSGSLFPPFGIKVKDVHVTYHSCDTSLQLDAPYMLFPFSFIDAIRKKLHLGYIKAGDIDLQILKKENVCFEQKQTTDERGVAQKTDAKETASTPEKNYDSFFQSLSKPFKRIKGLKAQNLSILFPKSTLLAHPNRLKKLEDAKEIAPGENEEVAKENAENKLKENESKFEASKKIEAQRLRITYDKSNEAILVSGGVKILQPGFDGFKKLPLSKLSLELNKAKGLRLDSQVKYHEGRFYLTSKYQRDLAQIRFAWQAIDFPLSFFIRTLELEKKLTTINPHLVWLNGSGELRLNYKNDLAAELFAESLRLKGDLLDAYAQNISLGILPKLEVVDPFEWRLEKLDLEQIADYLNYRGVKGVLRKAGLIRGTGIVNSLNEIVFDGSIEDLEFLFSRNGYKAYQKVQKAELSLEYMPNHLGLEFERIIFNEGDIEGSTYFKMNQDSSTPSWSFKSIGTSLEFNKNVYSLFGLSVSPFQDFEILVEGKGKETTKIDVSAKMESCNTSWGLFDEMELRLLAKDNTDKLRLRINSKDFTIDESHIKANNIVTDSKVSDVILNLNMDLEQNVNEFELTAKDAKKPFRVISKNFNHKKAFNGSLYKDNKVFKIHGNTTEGYSIQSLK